jgi:hypothetical protein
MTRAPEAPPVSGSTGRIDPYLDPIQDASDRILNPGHYPGPLEVQDDHPSLDEAGPPGSRDLRMASAIVRRHYGHR